MQKCCIHRTYWTRFVYFLDENMASLMFICRFSCFTLLFFSVEIMNFPRNGKLLFPESEWMEEKVDSTFYICCYCRWPLACGLFGQIVIFFLVKCVCFVCMDPTPFWHNNAFVLFSTKPFYVSKTPFPLALVMSNTCIGYSPLHEKNIFKIPDIHTN